MLEIRNMKSTALEYCIEVYEQYTREEINNFHGSIIRCWKTGKRAVKFQQACEAVAKQITATKCPKHSRLFREESVYVSK